MYRFIQLNYLSERVEAESFPSGGAQALRQVLHSPVAYRSVIQEALQHVKFSFHRTSSFENIINDCNVCEGGTLLMYWGCERTDSRVTMSLTASSCSSVVMLANSASKELRSTAQQTDISCRYCPSPGLASPISIPECEDRQFRSRLDSLTLPSPATSPRPPQPAGRSMSILGSVCALLLNKQQNASPKEVSSVSSEQICRICFGGASSARLVRPCRCRGTVAAVHRACLERWLLQAATSYCELCRHHYRVTRTHKWSWVRCVAQWAAAGGGRALAADACRGAALLAASVCGTARALHACDAALQAGARRGGAAALAANLFSSILIGLIGALNGLLTTWVLLKMQEHQASWQAWRDSALHVHVALDESAPGSDTTLVAPPAGRHTADRGTDVADPLVAVSEMSAAFVCMLISTAACCLVLLCVLTRDTTTHTEP